MDYSSAIDWLYGTQFFGIKLGLENMRRLCERFDLSTEGMRLVHVAGTNGKGSVCAIAESMARVAGHRTGLYTSPHLVSFCERIQVGGESISEADVARGLTELREEVESWDPHPTFFELATILAMRFFGEHGVEIAILETGMGGRLDATTAVAQWHFERGGGGVSVITPIAMDHEEWLGSTLGEIAAEKAGIIQPGVPVVVAEQEPAAAEVILAEGERARAEVHFVEAAWGGSEVGLAGEHQRRNAVLAVEALRVAGVDVSEDAMRRGAGEVRWRARFERIDLGGRGELVVDGAHNPAAAAALAETWEGVFGEERATLIFGAMQAKDVAEVLRRLQPLAERMIFCRIDSPRAVDPVELAALVEDAAGEVAVVEDARAALELAGADGGGRILVTGSLFLAGEVVAILGELRHEPSAQ
jgi:dihydrofolate synthase/folylpolyglutamate synthase